MIYVIGEKNQNLTLQLTEKALQISKALQNQSVSLLNVSNDIKDAPLIFAGGRGLMNKQSFEALRRLADFFDASVGASRPVVDCG